MGTKVYVLLYGYADERRIGGVYSTRAAATAAMRFGDENSVIQEHGVDRPLPEGPDGSPLWYVSYCVALPEFVAYRVASFERSPKPSALTRKRNKDLQLHLWARNMSEARRVAAEHFGRYLAAQGSTVVLSQMKAELDSTLA